MTTFARFKRWAPAFAGVTLFFPSGFVHAESAEQALQKFVDNVQTFSAGFEQVQKDEKGAVLQKNSGRMALLRPGKFRWAYEKPYEQLMVCDGQTIWLYDPDLKQVTIREARDALAGTPAELLSQRSTLKSQFTITDAGKVGDARVVRLIPKSTAGDFQSIELTLKNGVPQHMQFHDQLGNITSVSFNGIQTNRLLDTAQFNFTPPEGVELVQAESSISTRPIVK
ncbi:MAG: outer membrane lipoprotein chaperone LolA [Pseudomonadota bacterium]